MAKVLKRAPKNHRWCNACGGDGRKCGDRRRKCEVCKGKGYWNAQDILDYHTKYPHVCRASCGERHREPRFMFHKDLMREVERLEREIQKLVDRLD